MTLVEQKQDELTLQAVARYVVILALVLGAMYVYNKAKTWVKQQLYKSLPREWSDSKQKVVLPF